MPTWSGFWNHVYDTGHSLIDSNRVRRSFGLALRARGRQPYNEVIRALTGAAAGGTATGSYKRVAVQDVNDPTTLGGKRLVETKTAINRATTAADVTKIKDDLDFKNSPSPWPVDKSGNGGGGKWHGGF